jgi:lysozyme family protein
MLKLVKMAKIETLWPFILSWEGGFANVPGDRGGATKYGVTISTWKAQGYDKDGDGDIDIDDLRLITPQDAMEICRKNFWNRWKADQINDQSLANLLVDWLWGSGKYGITIPQQLLGVKADGIVGARTIAALNAQDPKTFFFKLWQRRKKYLNDICANRPTNYKFLKGWLRRLQGVQYGSLTLNTVPPKTVKFT